MTVPRSATRHTTPTTKPKQPTDVSKPIELGALNNSKTYNGAREDTNRGTNANSRPSLAIAGSSRTVITSRAPSKVGPPAQSNTEITVNAASREGIQTGHTNGELAATPRVIYGQAGASSSRSSTVNGGSVQDSDGGQKDLPVTPNGIKKLGDRHLAIDDFEYELISTANAKKDDKPYPKLDFKPWAIETWFLGFTILVFLVCIGSISTMIILGHHQTGGYHVTKTSHHLAFRYVPPAIGTLTTVWWRTIISTLARMTPYMTMAGDYGNVRNPRRLQQLLQNAYAHAVFEPMDLTSVTARNDWLLFISLIVQFVIMIMIIPLKAVFIQIVADEPGWTVIVVPGVGYALIAIYSTLILVIIAIIASHWGRETGLKWDPVSLADQLSLVQGSNVLYILQGLEFALSKACTKELKKRSPFYGIVRLGYWKHKTTGKIWHGLACIPPRLETPLDYELQRVEDPENYRYFSVPFLLSDDLLSLYAVGLTVIIALTITGLVNGRVERGINAIFSTWTLNKSGVTVEMLDNWAEGFRYRFLPVFCMTLGSALWIRADLFYRWTEPFARMDGMSDASLNIFLDYPSVPPVVITRVAAFSALALISIAPPIIATGVFISTPTPNGYTISIEPINFWTCFVLLNLYLIFLLIVRPPPNYRLPRSIRSIADVLTYCYASKLLDDVGPDGKPVFSAQDIDDERIHMKSRIRLTKKRYQFGLYLGNDGKRHLGFDVAVRDVDGKLVDVQRFDPGRGVRGVWPARFWLWRKPKVLGTSV
ncbi:uncharacterized protein PAC_15276 [Phialocephala subalpina]|uniref:Uncharacterized protein n=1 Tax=Phialocephala subalpina TaxID=576137 RepID=A0A1L7XKB7_9HELO|nr:uncharacterized protein PAC_15276 [Phialocephala subalpina]